MPFELRDHTADVGVAGCGDSIGEAMAAVADGMAAAQCDEIPPGGERFPVEVRAEGAEALLFDYLDELIYQRDVRGVLPADNEATVRGPADGDRSGESDERWILEGSARGVPLRGLDAREIKAVTYSEMRIEETDEGWEAHVVLDV